MAVSKKRTEGDLLPRQEMFVKEYLVDLNATQAAIRAGYSRNRAEVTAHQLMRNAKIIVAIEAAMAERAKRVEVDAEWVLRRLVLIADASVEDYIRIDAEGKDKGQPTIDISKLSREQFKAVAEIRVEDIESGKRTGKRTTIKFNDKLRALELIGKHIGMFVERKKIEHTGNIEVANAARNLELRLMEAAATVGAATSSSKLH